MKWLHYLRKKRDTENGFALVMVLMIVTVFSVLGVSLLTLVVNHTRLNTVDRDQQAAYYIAEAGATYRMSQIETIIERQQPANDQELLMQIRNLSVPSFEPVFGQQPVTEIDVTGENGSYVITSVGRIGDRERTVARPFTVNWQQRQGGDIVLPDDDLVLFANASDTTSGGIVSKSGNLSLNGAVGTNSTNDLLVQSMVQLLESINFSDNIYLPPNSVLDGAGGEDISYSCSDLLKLIPFLYEECVKRLEQEKMKEQDQPQKVKPFESNIDLPIFPNMPSDYALDLDEAISKECSRYFIIFCSEEEDVLHMDRNYQAHELVVGERNMRVEVEGSDRELVVNHLRIQDNLEIEGGNLTIYVRNKLLINPGITINSQNTEDKLTIYYQGEEQVDLSNITMNSHLFAEQANISLEGDVTYQGSIVTGGSQFSLDPRGHELEVSLVYAPLAAMLVKGQSQPNKVIGTFIIGELEHNGNHVDMESSNYNIHELPFTIGGSSLKHITIEKQPVREQS